MSWGVDLWDQFDNIAIHTQKGIEALEKYGNFIEQRSKIEQEYATKLRRLVKAFMPRKKEEDPAFSYSKSYRTVLMELGDQAGQHELIAENFNSLMAQELSIIVKQLKDDRRKYLMEGTRLTSQLQSSLLLLQKSKEKYEKAFGASERALENYQRADADLNLSRADVEKQRMNSAIKSQQCDEAKNEYANQLQKTNEAQRNYYHKQQPEVFQFLQQVDEKRISSQRDLILKAVKCEKNTLPIVNQCLDGIIQSAKLINENEDICVVIERYKSGFNHPEDIPFEDLTNTNASLNQSDNLSVNGSLDLSQSSIGQSLIEKKSIFGTITGGRVKKRSGLLGLFSSTKDSFSELPPNQRKKWILTKIEEVNAKLSQETATRDGMMKMKQVYEENPALGDPMSIQGQLTENEIRLEKIRSELKKYQDMLEQMEAAQNPAKGKSDVASKLTTPSKDSSTSLEGPESLSRSTSETSISKDNAKSHTGPNIGDGNESRVDPAPIRKVTCKLLTPSSKESENRSYDDGQHTTAATADTSTSATPNPGIENFESEPLPVLGKCRALYNFEATSDGSLPMTENEEFWVVENDQGDGWTRVRRLNASHLDPMPEGFVPTSYINTYQVFASPRPV